MNYTIEQVTSLIGARCYGDGNRSVSWLLTDSRSLCFPEETLFFAIRTQRNDGHRYIADLYRRGVRSFVVSHIPDGYAAAYPGAAFLRVGDTLTALQRLAERHRDNMAVPVIGITGSNGKTVVKEWLYQLLSPSMTVTRSPRSYNSQTGVPLSVWLMSPATQVGLFEAGISKAGEMERLADIIQPTIAVITNIGDAHQENFTTVDDKCREKLKLFRDARTIIYPADDEVISRCVGATAISGNAIAWSCRDEAAPLYIKKIEKDAATTTVTYIYNKGKASDGGIVESRYTLPFIDNASVSNSITCCAVAIAMGLDAQTIASRMATLEPVAMRLEVKEGQHGCTLINDSYNSDINSLDIALDFMNRRPETADKRRTLIISDIYESGSRDSELYGEVARLAVKRGVNKLIGIGNAISDNAEALSSVTEKYFFRDSDEFIRSDVFSQLHDEIILIKGARRFRFDRLTELLERRVHETILEVNLTAIVNNLNHFRSFMRPQTKIVCMVKADAYGCGAVEVARTLQDQGVDYLAVAVADEGVALRRAGITSSIMVMNPEMTSFKALFDYRLEPEVYSFRILNALISAARHEGITRWPVHIKIDTGMHRLGFDPEKDIDELIRLLLEHEEVLPRSVFSHFVGSDSDDFDRFSALQYDRFTIAGDRLQAAFPDHHILRHINNSAAIEHFPDRQLDMCRLGIGLYGIDSRSNTLINNVCTLKTTILQMRYVPANETVGYSRKGILKRDSVIAALPIGYADGLDRHLGCGNGYCLVNGHKAPYVGNICMDVALIDVTDIDCHEGDTAVIFGDSLPVTVIAGKTGTIAYEVLTSVSQRVKRVYFRD